MKIVVQNCDRSFSKEIKKACESYACNLFDDSSTHILDSLLIKIKFINDLGADGYCECINLCEGELPEEFIISINNNLGSTNALLTLGHEFVHVKQYALGELSDDHGSWKGHNVGPLGYYDQPWEQEADTLEYSLLERFLGA